MNTMTYKGYAARIEYSEEDGCFVGHLAGIRDIVGFDGKTVAQLKKRFHEAVDDYLWGCHRAEQTFFGPAVAACPGRLACPRERGGQGRGHEPVSMVDARARARC